MHPPAALQWLQLELLPGLLSEEGILGQCNNSTESASNLGLSRCHHCCEKALMHVAQACHVATI